MAEHATLAADRLQEYIEGRLSARDQAAVAAYLRARPAVAAEVDALRQQSEMLRGLGQEILDEPIPQRLREVLLRREPESMCSLRRRSPRFLEATAVLLACCAGGALGWYANDVAIWPHIGADEALPGRMVCTYAFSGERD